MEIRNRFTGALIASTPSRPHDFSGQNLMNADLRGSILSHFDFKYTRLVGADLRDASAGFADFSEADFRLAKLAGGIFSNGTFIDAVFRGADLRNTNFYGAQMARADFTGADIRGADFRGANLVRAIGLREAIGIDEILDTPQGALVGYKKIYDAMGAYCIVVLDIPAEARRVRAVGATAVRADRAWVKSIIRKDDSVRLERGHSRRDPNFEYVVGKLVTCERPFNDDITLECTSGIHFYLNEGDL